MGADPGGLGATVILQADAMCLPLANNSVDAIVTDPPYGLEFMGQEWDKLAVPKVGNLGGFADGTKPSFQRVLKHLPAMQAWHYAWAVEAIRVAKPGAHVVAFGGTRTHHRLMCALEDAGWEIRDCLMWLYGSGFPKSLDVSKAIDKAAGAERDIIGIKPGHEGFANRGNMSSVQSFKGTLGGKGGFARPWMDDPAKVEGYHAATAPATDAAKQWSGWGTALKPAWEPIILARKPLSERNMAVNVLKWGTGALNIDGCRIALDPVADASQIRTMTRNKRDGGDGWGMSTISGDSPQVVSPAGRWPANVVLDEEAGEMLDEQSGELTSGANPIQRHSDITRGIYGAFKGHDCFPKRGADSGGASRFFYCAKADRTEREIGMDGVEPQDLHWSSGHKNPGSFQSQGTNKQAANNHPTVKPINLMIWLCRLVTPTGGLILDPFTGSGSTGIGALRAGFRFIGIEKDPKWVRVARQRIMGDAPLFNRMNP